MTLTLKKAVLRGATSLTAFAVLCSTQAYAQDAGASKPDAEEGPAIVVTGSRIASPIAESNAPLQIVDSARIAQSGVTNIQDLLLKNPAFGTPTFSRTNSAFLTSGTGVASIDLRDLGSARTLVLVNGRRVVASVPGSSTVDLNVIPTQFLERVDVLTGGASSLYGSDAVAGVVNFVYKKDFQGLEGDAQYGITEHGDSPRYQANLTMGSNFDDGRGNIMVNFGYSNEKGLLSRQRKGTQVDNLDTSIYVTGDIADYGKPYAPAYSSYPEQGRFVVGLDPATKAPYNFTYGPDGALQSCSTTSGLTCSSSLGDGTGPNGFNRQQYRTLAVPVQRYTLAAVGHYDVSDDISFFFEGTYNKTQSSRIIEPFALSSDTSTGVYPATGRMPLENYVIGANGVGVLTPNPLVPAEILAAATDTDGDGLRDMGFARRLSEFGNRTGKTTRDFLRFVVGFEGTILDKFNWDLSYNYGQVTENQTSNGQVNINNFRNALAAMTDADGNVVCIDAEARANGCVPVNIFGKGSISQEAIQYIAAQQSLQTNIKQQVVQGNVSGSLFDLPAGPLGIAVGFEYRKESSSEDNDALTNQGLNGGNQLPDTYGQFDVIEGYAEVKAPILKDQPFAKLLEIGGALRTANYSTVGTIYSYNVQGTWQPISDLRIRGSWARSVRAPNIGELYQGLAQTFPAGIQDPCEGVTATTAGALGTNCRAAPGVAANIAANGEFTLTQADAQSLSGFDSGNANLKEEKSTSWTVGAVINPRSFDALRNLTITADYYNIKIDNVIDTIGRTTILNQCYTTGDPFYCDRIVRRPTETSTNSSGSIEFVNDYNVNGATLKTQGLDVTASWFTPVHFFNVDGALNLNLSYTHLFQYDYTAVAGGITDPSDGEIGTAGDRFTTTLGYTSDKFKWSFTGTFIGKSYEDDQSYCASFDLPAKCVSVPAIFYLDTQASVAPVEKFEFYFGIDNLLNTKAPNILSGSVFNVTGSNTAADVYDIFGRRYYAGIRFHF
ncbi:TonB-dependent receptor [Novosphingobium sp. BL-8A]|uniref:TonB-dependent receptor domain-containing protein n=1 Tax=Novosphingobium sp. BL-8A TaxID=3127639 RepID=UPI003757EADA